ncbi:hypothetical protein AQUCO_01700670v1 [Aquilegia coerulea]|uniref:Glycosyltransferase 2-like domain-containing protein n=1 Tax=Aquilegia coerulea TaxID=218851 RepID=A0A2G5DP63_AQUCA|nr:hypothetical protein AQUCO_01700670v1 [Aquilegia coerulea]
MEIKLPLHAYQVHQSRATINKIHTLVFSISLLSLLYYRFSTLLQITTGKIPWLLITMSEFLLSLFWILGQAFRWRPISRTAFPERLPSDESLPPIDVFIFTCDPKKEPTIGVMNTLLSALCLDYPPEKLFVYLSDDGGAPIMLYAAGEAYNFAKLWVPFCKKYGIKTIAPEAFFSSLNDEEHCHMSSEFFENLQDIKSRYKVFKQLVENAVQNDESCLTSTRDRPACIEVMRGNAIDELDKRKVEIPNIVYVSREKRSNHHHNFKAGAINALSFYNVSKNDIYNTPLRTCMKIWWHGLDGLMGPPITGTCFYLKREALYKNSAQGDINLFDGERRFGCSDAFIASICRKHVVIDKDVASNKVVEEARAVASSTYEENTQWGKQIGFLYQSVVEDLLTGIFLNYKGWNSVFYDPLRPAFLGTGTTNLNDTLVQNKRWYSGFLQICFSQFFPLTYRPSRVPILQIMAYLYILLLPFNTFLVLCHSTIPQLCLFNGIKLYPKVSDLWFAIFLVIYLSSLIQTLMEVLITGGSLKLFWNEQRLAFFIRSTSNLFACFGYLKKCIGMKEIDFTLTNKSSKDGEMIKYQMDVYDFETDRKFLLILTTIVSLNITSLAIGIRRAIMEETYNEWFGQIFLSLIITVLNYPLIEGMIIRKDEGRIPTSITLLSILLVIVLYQARVLLL